MAKYLQTIAKTPTIMKSVFLFLSAFFLLPTPASSQQPQVDPTGNVVFTQIAELPGLSAEDIYDRAKDALVFVYDNAPGVTHRDNPKHHYLMVKGVFPNLGKDTSNGDVFNCHYILKIECKAAKIRMTIYLSTFEMIANDMTSRTLSVADTNPANPQGASIPGMKEAWANLMKDVNMMFTRVEHSVKHASANNGNW